MLLRTHLGVSLDGFIATPDGLPAWDALPTFGPGTHGIDEFTQQIDALVMGRITFDQGLPWWVDAWPDKQLYVLTSRPLPTNVPAGVIGALDGPAALLAHLRGAGLRRDVQVHGGARTIQTFLELGAIDRLGLVLLPVRLGWGIPLFATERTSFSPEAWAAAQGAPSAMSAHPLLQLTRHHAYPDGAIELVYAPA